MQNKTRQNKRRQEKKRQHNSQDEKIKVDNDKTFTRQIRPRDNHKTDNQNYKEETVTRKSQRKDKAHNTSTGYHNHNHTKKVVGKGV